MKRLSRAEVEAISAQELRAMGVHIRTLDDGAIVYETMEEIPSAGQVDEPFPPLPWRSFLDLLDIDLKIRPAVDAYVEAAPQRVRDEFYRTQSFERHHPLLEAAVQALGLDPLVVDTKWRIRAEL